MTEHQWNNLKPGDKIRSDGSHVCLTKDAKYVGRAKDIAGAPLFIRCGDGRHLLETFEDAAHFEVVT